VKPRDRAIRIVEDDVVLRPTANRHDAAAQLDGTVHGVGTKYQDPRGHRAIRL
jgi:hypothetical protein